MFNFKLFTIMAKVTKAEVKNSTMTNLLKLKEQSNEQKVAFKKTPRTFKTQNGDVEYKIADLTIGDESYMICFKLDSFEEFKKKSGNLEEVVCWVTSSNERPGYIVGCHWEEIDEEETFE